MPDIGKIALNSLFLSAPWRLATYNTDTIDVNDAENVAFDVDVPDHFSSAFVEKIIIRTNGGATLPPITDAERGFTFLERNGVNVLNRIQSDAPATLPRNGTTNAIDNVYQWTQPFLFLPLYPEDNIKFILPPCDDNGTPTGDYVLSMLIFRVLTF